MQQGGAMQWWDGREMGERVWGRLIRRECRDEGFELEEMSESRIEEEGRQIGGGGVLVGVAIGVGVSAQYRIGMRSRNWIRVIAEMIVVVPPFVFDDGPLDHFAPKLIAIRPRFHIRRSVRMSVARDFFGRRQERPDLICGREEYDPLKGGTVTARKSRESVSGTGRRGDKAARTHASIVLVL